MSAAYLREIVTEEGSPGWKAEQCLAALLDLPYDDLARPELLATAQVYATLELAARIGESGSGRGLVESIREAGGIQP